MKQKKNVFRTSLIARLAILAALIVGGGNYAWAQKSLPYSYGFENNDLEGEGWTMTDCANGGQSYNTTGIYSNYGYQRNGTYCFRFYVSSSAQYLITPELSSSATGIEVSFYYNANVTVSGTRNFSIGYSTTNAEVSSFNFTDFNSIAVSDKNYHILTATCPTGTKYVAIKYNSNMSIYIDDITIEAQEQYKAPSNFSVSSMTSNSATFSWANGRDETAWEIAYSTKEGFDPSTEGVKIAVTANPATLTGLVEGVTYYAYVRANYDGNYSSWSNKAEFTPIMKFTINDGTTTSYYDPIYGYKANYDFKSQIIIPKGSLESMIGRNITQLTFYASQTSANWGDARYDVYLNEVENSTYTLNTPVFESWGTKVCANANLSISDNAMLIIFDSPYSYGGGNLMIGFQSTATGSSVTSSWYGVSGTNNVAYYSYGYNSYTTNRAGHLPKITFMTSNKSIPVTLGDNGYTTFACPRPLDLTAANLPSGLKAYKAAVDGDRVKFTEVNQAVAANTGILLEGTAGETYHIPVADEGTEPADNEFLVNSTGGTFSAESGYTYYGMLKNSNPLTFGVFNPSTVAIPTNKAYLKVSSGAASRQLTAAFHWDVTTGIEDTDATTGSRKSGSVFSLTGQQVKKPAKGLYIIDGKKHITK